MRVQREQHRLFRIIAVIFITALCCSTGRLLLYTQNDNHQYDRKTDYVLQAITPSHKGVETAAAVLFADFIIAHSFVLYKYKNAQIYLYKIVYNVN